MYALTIYKEDSNSKNSSVIIYETYEEAREAFEYDVTLSLEVIDKDEALIFERSDDYFDLYDGDQNRDTFSIQEIKVGAVIEGSN